MGRGSKERVGEIEEIQMIVSTLLTITTITYQYDITITYYYHYLSLPSPNTANLTTHLELTDRYSAGDDA